MAAVNRFEDLIAWQRGRALVSEVYDITGQGRLAADAELRDQMRRAAISVVSNIAEGFERFGRRDFARCVGIAKGSAAEVRTHVLIAADLGLLTEADCSRVLARCHELARLLTNLRRALERPRQEPRP